MASNFLRDFKRRISRRTALAIFAGATISLGNRARAEALPPIKISRSPDCGCCHLWAEHLRSAGFAVTLDEPDDLQGLKDRLGVPADLASCHTGEIAGYVIEGHVPVRAILQLLAEKPNATGLAVAGMPIGSPGMEGGTPEAYDVVLFGPDGNRNFGRYLGSDPV